ncbi:MAG TPA: TMEM175 family protein [Candidatus Eisenbacteria bacterium]|nr:TMEM175 family protein [Candidatus Eisenbacteria bacterium]
MTLLVLNIVIPTVGLPAHSQQPIWAPGALASEATVWNALVPLGPHLLTYLMSFLTLGIFWAGQQTQLNFFARSDHRLTWIHLVFLLAVVFMPFSTALLAEFITYRLLILIYWFNLFSLGLLLFISLEYASRAGLLAPEATKEVGAASKRRIIVYQILYACAALLCVFNTCLAIAVWSYFS